MILELHQEKPVWESTKQYVGTYGMDAAGLAAVATVWAGGLAAPTPACLSFFAAVAGERKKEEDLGSTNTCFFMEVSGHESWV